MQDLWDATKWSTIKWGVPVHMLCLCAKKLQSWPTLCHPMDCSPPGSSVHGILQARIPEWVAMPSSGGSFRPRNRTQLSYVSSTGWWVLSHQHPLGSPHTKHAIFIPILISRQHIQGGHSGQRGESLSVELEGVKFHHATQNGSTWFERY